MKSYVVLSMRPGEGDSAFTSRLIAQCSKDLKHLGVAVNLTVELGSYGANSEVFKSEGDETASSDAAKLHPTGTYAILRRYPAPGLPELLGLINNGKPGSVAIAGPPVAATPATDNKPQGGGGVTIRK